MENGSSVVERDAAGPVYPLTRALAGRRKMRRCLHCGSMFDSESPSHRFCGWCKNYLHHNDEDDPHQAQVRIGRCGRFDSGSLAEQSGVASGNSTEDLFADGGFDSEPAEEIPETTWRLVLAM